MARSTFLGAALLALALPARADFEAPTVNDRQAIDVSAPSTEGSAFTPGKGFSLANTPKASLNVSLYLLVRYLTQWPAEQSYTDHLGNQKMTDPTNSISAPHRVLLGFYGFMLDPKFSYNCTIWTVNATDKVAVIGDLSYMFSKALDVHVGVGGMPGTRSILGSHPYWLGTDRVMADEYFRAGFTQGLWALGEPLPGFWYRAMVGNNISTLGLNQNEDTRPMAVAGSVWWLPTTHEFGPRGGYGDYEHHERLATRVGASATHSQESRFTQVPGASPESTQVRIGDGQLLFAPGSLANGVQLNDAVFDLVGTDAALKYKGFFMHTEFYNRWLTRFHADGPLPISRIHDWGFHVQAAKMIVPKKWELYAATSWVFADPGAGFRESHDWLGGLNWYAWSSRNSRINLQIMDVRRTATSSSFGYYTAGQSGQTYSLAWAMLF